MTRHRFDPLSFLAGALFVFIAAVAVAEVPLFRLVDLRLLGPGLLILVGVVLLLTIGRSPERVPVRDVAEPTVADRDERPPEEVDTDDTTDPDQ